MEKNKKALSIQILFAFLTIILSLSLTFCFSDDEEEEQTTAETSFAVSSVEVSADERSLIADGASTSIITATVKNATNQSVEGARVIFETTRGSIISSSPITDINGQAVATLTSDRYTDSDVIITASCQGVQATATVSFTGIALALEASPESLVADGSTASTIIATLTDAAGNTMPDVAIDFSTDKGQLSESSVTTDIVGKAQVILTSSESGTATITATSRGARGTTTVTFSRYLLSLEANPTTIRAGGSESSTITAKLYDSGSLIATNETIVFSTSLGDLNTNQVITTNGEATTTLTSSTQSGIATVDAQVTIASTNTVVSASTHVNIVGGAAAKIVLTASPKFIATETGEATITATVYDANDDPSANQEIYFCINEGPGGGEYLESSTETTNNSGVAQVTLYAGFLESVLEGVTVEANTEPNFSGNFGLTSLTIAGPVGNIGVGIDLHNLEPEGGHLKVDVSAIATDVNGNPAPDDTEVHFSVTAIGFDEDRDDDSTIDCWDADGQRLTCDNYYDSETQTVIQGTLGVTWFTDDVNLDGAMYNTGGKMAETEDINANGILESGEDKNGNGVIDPINSCSIPSTIATTNGVAVTSLYYLQTHADNIKIRITAEAGGVSNFYDTILLCTENMVEQDVCGIDY